MAKIHSTAIVSNKAQIDDDVEIGPYCIIEDDVQIGKGSKLYNNVTVYNGARIGEDNKFFPYTAIASPPQDLKYNNEPTETFIGNNNSFRECVTISRGTTHTYKTTIGDDCLFMAYSHIAHDCRIGSKIVLANSVAIAGHVHLEDWVIVGGVTGIHQFVSVGQHCMVGAVGFVSMDIPPFTMFAGNPVNFEGLNIIGLRRRGFSTEKIDAIKKAYNLLYMSGFNTTQAVNKIKEELGGIDEVEAIIKFIGESRRGITRKK